MNRSKSLAAPQREASLNFISLANRLMAAKSTRGELRRQACEKIRSDLDQYELLTDKTWLLAMLDGLENG